MSSSMMNVTVPPNATMQAQLLEAEIKAQLSANLGLNLGPFLLGRVEVLIRCSPGSDA